MWSALRKLVSFTIVYVLAFVFASWVLFLMIVKTLWLGRKYFEVKERLKAPECLSDAQLGQHAFLSLKEIKIHYVEAGDRNKPLMLFVHGFPEFWYSWRYQMKEFKNYYWVVAIDLPGYGDSDKPAGKKPYTVSKLVHNIKDVIEGLGKTSCVLVAHDWGGILAWKVAIDYPDLVEKLIVMNSPHPNAYMKHVRNNFKQLLMSWYVFAVQWPYFPELFFRAQDMLIIEKVFRGQIHDLKSFTDEDLEAYKFTFSKPGAFTPPLNYYRNIFFSSDTTFLAPNTTKTSKPIHIPVLIIWGKNDIALHLDLAQMSSKFASNCDVKIIPKASHWVQQDAAYLVNDYMSDFLFDYSKPVRFVRRMRSMRRQLVTSVSGVMRWTGITNEQPRYTRRENGIVSTIGKRMVISTLDLLHRLSGAPFTGLQNLAVVI